MCEDIIYWGADLSGVLHHVRVFQGDSSGSGLCVSRTACVPARGE